MRFSEIFSSPTPALSFEFFPPKQESSIEGTKALMRELAELKPDFMTVTYGAGGGTRHFTRELVSYIHNILKLPAVAHLTCCGHSAAEIDAVLDELSHAGISHVLALRGDPPKGATSFTYHPEGFRSAEELTAHIARRKQFSVAVAGYPETHQDAKSPQADIEYLKRKVDAGAEVVITQLFFNNDSFYAFRDRAYKAGIRIPILPGLMPVANVSQIQRFTQMCGASIPELLERELSKIADSPEAVLEFGIQYAINQAQDLLRNEVPGIHLYTLNRSVQAKPIVESINAGR